MTEPTSSSLKAPSGLGGAARSAGRPATTNTWWPSAAKARTWGEADPVRH